MIPDWIDQNLDKATNRMQTKKKATFKSNHLSHNKKVRADQQKLNILNSGLLTFTKTDK